jgi:hypothetical protein
LHGDAQSGAVTGETVSIRLTPETLGAALLGLSPADRARLAAMLLGQQTGHGNVGK